MKIRAVSYMALILAWLGLLGAGCMAPTMQAVPPATATTAAAAAEKPAENIPTAVPALPSDTPEAHGHSETEVDYSTIPTPAPMAGEAEANKLVFGSNLATMDQAIIRLANAPAAPEGFTYQAWLVNEDGSYTSLGALTPAADGMLEHTWTTPDGANLLNRVTGAVITLEPTGSSLQPSGKEVYAGAFTPEKLVVARNLFVSNQGEPTTPRNTSFASGLLSQIDLADQHVLNAVNAAAIGATAEMKLHLEHVINILEGSQGERFQDYTGDGKADNPGDGFGVLGYSSQIAAQLGAPEELREIEGQIQSDVQILEQKCLEILQMTDSVEIHNGLVELESMMEVLHHGTVASLYLMAQQAIAIDIVAVP